MQIVSPRAKWIGVPSSVDHLLDLGDQVHLDAARAFDPDGPVREAREIEVGVELAVEAREQVQVEGGGHARGVVVGALEHARVLLEVDAHQEGAARPARARATPAISAIAPDSDRFPIVEPGK